MGFLDDFLYGLPFVDLIPSATGCTCGAFTEPARGGGACPPGQTHLRYYYTGSAVEGGQKTSYYDVCKGRCNPLACSNAACTNTIGCVGARNQFCLEHGKQCGSVKKCFVNGKDPCPASTCFRDVKLATDEQARLAVYNYLKAKCGMANMDEGTVKNWLNGYSQIRGQIVAAWKACSLTQANQLITKAGDALRCSAKCHTLIRGKCDSGIPNCSKPPTCQGDPGTPVDCNENPATWGNCVGDLMGKFCHNFDFIPGGGCNPQTQTAIFFGAAGIIVMILLSVLKSR